MGAESTDSTDAAGQESAEGKSAEDLKVEKTSEDEIKDSWDAESDHENEHKGNSGLIANLKINKTFPPNSKLLSISNTKRKVSIDGFVFVVPLDQINPF